MMFSHDYYNFREEYIFISSADILFKNLCFSTFSLREYCIAVKASESQIFPGEYLSFKKP